ncbi:MAG: hypothetical protein K2X94_02925 [Amoebophilaceae bacterium]|nr:hypothetical protein [Amoebophilaceae bacterium]
MVFNHGSLFGKELTYQQSRDKSLFSVNQKLPIHFGVKGWGRLQVGSFPQIGWECAIGSFVEWRFLNGLGLQTGLFYNFQELVMLDLSLDGKSATIKEVVKSAQAEQEDLIKYDLSKTYGIKPGLMVLHNISIPLLLRFYPEKSRQLVLYVGPRFTKTVAGKKTIQFMSLNLSPNSKKDIASQGLKPFLLKCFSGKWSLSGQNAALDKMYKSLIYWDFGFEFHGKNGFIMGINQMGLVFGYDCTKLFCKK